MRKSLTVDYWRDGGFYVGQVREIPAVASQGRTFAELQHNLRDAYDLVVADALEDYAAAFAGRRLRPARSLHVRTRKLLVTA